MTLAYGLWSDQAGLSKETLLIALLGFFNGFAAYCQWRAIHISLSKNSLFTFWDDIIGMTLSYSILGESGFINLRSGLGIGLSLAVVILFAIHGYNKAKKNGEEKVNLSFYGYVALYSIIWGVATFVMRYSGVHGKTGGRFIWSWYGGTLLAALVLLIFYKDQSGGQQKASALTMRDLGVTFVLSACVTASLVFTYASYQQAPQVIVQPIFLVGEMTVPSMLGLYLFKEIKELDWWEKFLFFVGIIGGILVAMGPPRLS